MRTKKTMKNFIVSTILTTIIALVGLVKSKLFLVYLGDELTGIYQLFSQLYSYISLVDAGLTSSLLYSLYKPVSEKNYESINSILKAGRKFFNIVAIIMIAIGLLVSFKIDFFVSELTEPLIYIQLSFILFIIASSLNYMVTARKCLFEADQNLYNVYIVVYGTMIFKAILEIIFVMCGLKLISLMILFLIMSVVQNLLIYKISKKKYSYINYNVKEDKGFIKETKNLIVQRIGGLVFNNIDILLISKFINPASIVIYTNYNYIVNSLLNIIKKIGSSSLASIGNLLVTEKEKARDVFYEYNAFCIYIASLLFTPLLFSITPFIKIYYGAKYMLPTIGMVCVVIITFIKIINMSLDVFVSALGLFEKIKKCIIIEAIINLILSIVLIFKFGISGVLIATVISYFFGTFNLYPKILNKYYFKDNKINYYSQTLKLFCGNFISIAITYLISFAFKINNIFIWIIFGIVITIINFVIITIYYKILKQDKFYSRFKEIIKEIIQKKKNKEGK